MVSGIQGVYQTAGKYLHDWSFGYSDTTGCGCDEAVDHYTRFADLWQDCDPQFAPLVTDAKDRLARLQSR